MATFKPVVFSQPKHIKSDGTTNIKVRVYHNKTSQYIPTDYYIYPDDIGDGGNIQSSNQNSEILNFELGELIQSYRKITIKLGTVRVSRMSCAELRDYITDAVQDDYELIDFVSFSRNVIAEINKPRTAEWYQRSLDSYIWFVGTDKIDARDITKQKIQTYIKQLSKAGKSGDPLKPGAISNYVRGLRTLYNQCKEEFNDEDHEIIRIQNKPFPKGIIPRYKRTKKSITIEDIVRIRDFEATTKRTEIARDCFMMMFYLMGINVNDLYQITPPNRQTRVIYERSKTDTEDNLHNYPLSICIEPELQILFDKYSERSFLSILKRRYSSSKNFMRAVNEGMDDICEYLSLPKITTNWARHTWASLARNKAGISKTDIDFCLGHVNNDTKMADIYIDIDYGIFDECNRKVLDLLK